MAANRFARISVVLPCLLSTVHCFADATANAADSVAPTNATYKAGKTAVAKFGPAVRFYTNREMSFATVPEEMKGLSFTRRDAGPRGDLSLSVPADTVVYLIISDGSGSASSRDAAKAAGWSRFEAGRLVGNGTDWGFVFFRRPAGAAVQVTLPNHVETQVTVVARHLTVDATPASPNSDHHDAEPTATAGIRPDGHPNTAPLAGATSTEVALRQTSINALEVFEPGGGVVALGQSSELVLTTTPAKSPHLTAVTFATPVGPEMRLARDEAMRYVRVTYPNWAASAGELSFEDKYNDHDGGSIGAAVGTLVMSAIKGVKIDPTAAMTGDISANGRVRAIGEVAAKLRGAAAGHCTVVALPQANYEQLVDAVIYSGVTIATDVQVIGMDDIDGALAAVRVDRDPKLTDAMRQFEIVISDVKKSADALKQPSTVAALRDIVGLAPQHLSAKVLLAIAEGTAPKTLSLAASRYYTNNAVQRVVTAFADRSAHRGGPPSSVVRNGLVELRKLRPLADPADRPLIDAWVRFIEAVNGAIDGTGSRQNLDRQRQSLLDEMANEDADPELRQKVLKQGM